MASPDSVASDDVSECSEDTASEALDFLAPDPSMTLPGIASRFTTNLTRYELARVIQDRAERLAHNAPPRVPVKEGKKAIAIAFDELRAGKIDTIVRRYHPDGTVENVAVRDLFWHPM